MKINNKVKVVVFGGNGFIGTSLCEELKRNNFDVYIYDQNIYEEKKGLKFYQGDILDKKKIEKVTKGAKYVFHFAGISDIELSNEDALNTFNTNVLGTITILNACLKNKINRIFFASSIYIYSNKGGFYKISKQTCESIIKEYSERYNLKFTIIRFGSIYGPNSNALNFIYQVISDALNKGIMIRKGDGNELREYIHVSDAANGVLKLLSNKFINAHVMLTGSQKMSIREILDMINEILGKQIKIKYLGKRLSSHYKITPYNFEPILAKKVNLDQEIDLGEGIYNLISQIYKKKLSD